MTGPNEGSWQLRSSVPAASKEEGRRFSDLLEKSIGEAGPAPRSNQLDTEACALGCLGGGFSDCSGRKFEESFASMAATTGREAFWRAWRCDHEPPRIPDPNRQVPRFCPRRFIVDIRYAEDGERANLDSAGLEKGLQLDAVRWVTSDQYESGHGPTTSGIANRSAS
jgi:hypothetical protein